MDIIEFIEDANLLNDRSLSVYQKMGLKAVYGLEMDPEELEAYRRSTGLERYDPKEWDEVSFILGRGSGKTDKLGTNIVLYEAVIRERKLSRGERGICMIVSPELRRQSRIAFDYCLGKLEASRVLRKMIQKATVDTIDLTNGMSIQVFPCSIARIRGQSLAVFLADEVAFWRVEGKNVDKLVLDSARPALRLEYAKMIKISSPWSMTGEAYGDYRNHFGKEEADVLVIRGSTEDWNPAFSKAKLERAKRRDPVAYATEYEANFRQDLMAMYDPELIDRAVSDRPVEIPYQWKWNYVSFVDVAGGGGKDSYAMAIGHLENERIVIDAVRSRAPKFNPEEVTRQYCDLLKSYKIGKVYGDKFSGDWASNAYVKFGISYERAVKTKSEIYIEAESAFNTERVDLPDREKAVNQLKSLVRKARSGGRDSVDTDSGQPEDEANVICGVIDLLMNEESGKAYFRLTDNPMYGESLRKLTPDDITKL